MGRLVTGRLYENKYFSYRGQNYGYGTVVKLNQSVYKGLHSIERCDGIVEFCRSLTNGVCIFRVVTNEPNEMGSIHLNIPLEDSIEYIVTPVIAELKPVWVEAWENYKKTPNYSRPDIAPGTILFIIAILVTTIFKANILLWTIETILYIRYLINMYRD